MKHVTVKAGAIATVILIVTVSIGWTLFKKEDIHTVVIRVPGLKNPECSKIIQDAFLSHPAMKGVVAAVRPDFQTHEVTISYNSMILAKMNLETTIASLGFDANDTKAPSNAVAALPPQCR